MMLHSCSTPLRAAGPAAAARSLAQGLSALGTLRTAIEGFMDARLEKPALTAGLYSLAIARLMSSISRVALPPVSKAPLAASEDRRAFRRPYRRLPAGGWVPVGAPG